FGFMIVFFVSAALFLWWDDYKKTKISQVGGEFEKAYAKVINNNVSEGMKLFKALAQNNKTIYNTLASLNIAAYEDYKKNYEMAIKHYTEVIEDKNASDLFKDFAKLM